MPVKSVSRPCQWPPSRSQADWASASAIAVAARDQATARPRSAMAVFQSDHLGGERGDSLLVAAVVAEQFAQPLCTVVNRSCSSASGCPRAASVNMCRAADSASSQVGDAGPQTWAAAGPAPGLSPVSQARSGRCGANAARRGSARCRRRGCVGPVAGSGRWSVRSGRSSRLRAWSRPRRTGRRPRRLRSRSCPRADRGGTDGSGWGWAAGWSGSGRSVQGTPARGLGTRRRSCGCAGRAPSVRRLRSTTPKSSVVSQSSLTRAGGRAPEC